RFDDDSFHSVTEQRKYPFGSCDIWQSPRQLLRALDDAERRGDLGCQQLLQLQLALAQCDAVRIVARQHTQAPASLCHMAATLNARKRSLPMTSLHALETGVEMVPLRQLVSENAQWQQRLSRLPFDMSMALESMTASLKPFRPRVDLLDDSAFWRACERLATDSATLIEKRREKQRFSASTVDDITGHATVSVTTQDCPELTLFVHVIQKLNERPGRTYHFFNRQGGASHRRCPADAKFRSFGDAVETVQIEYERTKTDEKILLREHFGRVHVGNVTDKRVPQKEACITPTRALFSRALVSPNRLTRAYGSSRFVFACFRGESWTTRMHVLRDFLG
ncbi:MAG: hypothetical protein MHM6MM_009187, partial [Cercozoa sp. M6MM]